MQIERSNQRDLTPDEQAHLSKLRKLVQDALADGKISETEIQSVREFVHADRVVTVEELTTINSTIREVLGNANIEFDWD